jgi:anaerobic ribonucleoside-triphosphate reductase
MSEKSVGAGSARPKCTAATEVYSRVCGFFRPVQQWNRGKKQEFRDRKTYKIASRDDATTQRKP